MDSVDDKLDAFNDLFLTYLNNNAPFKTVKEKHKANPFITEDMRECIATRDHVHKKVRRSGTEEDWAAFRSSRKEIKQTLRKAEQDYYNQEIVANKNNSTAIWKTIRHTLPNKSDQGTPYAKDTSVLANSADSPLVY